MYETAKQIGLPASFIDYRHDAIHGDLPSLIVFREATRKALEWLWKDYWKHLIVDTRTHGQGDRPLWNDQLETFKQQARLILQSYRSAASTITSPSQLQGSLNPVAPDAACLRLVKLCQSEKPALAELVNLLVEEDLLIPDSRRSVHCPATGKVNRLIFDRLGDAMDGIISMWNGLLKHLTFHQQLFLNLLTQKLITQIISLSLIDPKVDIDRETVHFWLLEIYTSREWTSARKRGKINANDLLTICLENPNLWTDSVASALINQPVCRKLGQIYKDRITASVTITAQATPHDSQAPKISEEKLADLLAYQQVWLEELEISRKEEKGAGSPNLAAGGWQKWSGEWIAKPFGTIQPSYLARRSLGPFLGSD